jgi:hypothetical protein
MTHALPGEEQSQAAARGERDPAVGFPSSMYLRVLGIVHRAMHGDDSTYAVRGGSWVKAIKACGEGEGAVQDGNGLCCWVLLRGRGAARKAHRIVALYHTSRLGLQAGKYRRWGWRRILRLREL